MAEPTANDTDATPAAAPATAAGAGEPAPAAVGVSPSRLAFRRFLRHRLAVAGSLAVIVMALAVAFGPMVLPHDPTLIRSWLRELPPAARVPDALGENRLALAAEPDVPATWLAAGAVTIHAEQIDATLYRIVQRRGLISDIALDATGQSIATLDLAGPYVAVREQLADGHRDLPKHPLTVGQPPPPGVFAADQAVIYIQTVDAVHERLVHAEFTAGRVTALSLNGEPVADLTIPSTEITRVTDPAGRELALRFWLGTDALGRDMLVRILSGGRISLMIGVVATLVSLLIGVLYGATSGYLGGRIDRLMMGGVDVLYAIPFMFVVIILMVLVGRSLIMLFVALGAVQWLTMSRIVRGQVLSLREQEFIAAARLSGCSAWTIVTRHLIPHTIGPVVVYTSLTVPAVILEESFLAFIGLAVQWNGQNLSSWGLLVHDGILALGDGGERAWLLIAPALALATTLFGLNALGDGLRDAFDPKHAKV